MKKNSYSIKHIVTNDEIDDLNHVNNVSYLKWVQDISQQHWAILSNNELNKLYVWVVLRHEIDYLSSAFLNDTITISTWVGDSYGVKSERFVEIKKESKVIVKAKTIWCLLDKNTMKPVRIPQEVLNVLENN